MDFYFDGGHEEAERKILVAYPEDLRDEPFMLPLALRVTPRDPDEYPAIEITWGLFLALASTGRK